MQYLGVSDDYFAAYLCSTYGKNSDLIIEKANSFKEGTFKEQIIRAELWYCIHYEMTNSLADFFVRRTARLYFDIGSVSEFFDVILQDFIEYLKWDKKRIELEIKIMKELIQDATQYYDKEFE